MLFSVYFRNIDFSSIKTVTALKEMAIPTSRLWLKDRIANYFLAATIDCNTPEEAFDIMQSDEQHWSQHEEISSFEGANLRSMMVGDVVITPSGDELLTVGNGFTAIHGCMRLEQDMSVTDAPPINPLGEEIINHIHRLLKQEKYKRGAMRASLFDIIEKICDGYFKFEGLIKLAHDLNVP